MAKIICNNKDCVKHNSCLRYSTKKGVMFCPYIIKTNPVKWYCDYFVKTHKKGGSNAKL